MGESQTQIDQIDLSEETRLAQWRRIEELKAQIGTIKPIGEKQVSSARYQNLGVDQNQLFASRPHFTSSVSSSSSEGGATGKAFRPRTIPGEHTIYLSSGSGSNDWFEDDGINNGAEPMQLDFEHSQVLANIDHFDVSDETSQSLRTASTPSKASMVSSNTSADIADTTIIKLEPDESTFLNDGIAQSSLSSDSSALSPLKSTTPTTPPPKKELMTPKTKRRRISAEPRTRVRAFRPRTAIPADVLHEELARQSVEAALSSRLNPFVLHPSEYQLIRKHICHSHVSAYLNIRNRILRSWVRNPLVTVTPEEAAGCAYSSKWLGLAEVAYEWLVRRGYINFGCVEVPDPSELSIRRPRLKKARKTIVVIGAGMAGLGCARQLEGLFSHYQSQWTSAGDDTPRIIVLEGRRRIGGRIYSHPLKNQASTGIPEGLRCTTECGAHIITGFDHGNPLNMIIRGQLALHYYPLKDNSCLYDIDGKVVDRNRDRMVEKLFNDILERASVYRHRLPVPITVEGNRDVIEAGRDPSGEPGKPISVVEDEHMSVLNKPPSPKDKGLEQVPAGLDKLTGRTHMVTGSRQKTQAALAAQGMGWTPHTDASAQKDINLDFVTKSSAYPTLGMAMDEGIRQYQSILDLSAQDLRLLNWHFANLEYANAANIGNLSLGGWDQDIGNEFEGEHAQVIGGYIKVPAGILQHPYQLNLRTQKEVTKIAYDPDATSGGKAKVTCDDGEVIEADHVVLTASLGVLKSRSITFEPQLPEWKLNSIDRLGFGMLNKVILAYEAPFWDVDQDMIGLLRGTEPVDSLSQQDYCTNRGRFYLFWNCIKTAGRPVLIALMAGEAAQQAEELADEQIVAEVSEQLATMFKLEPIPQPSETIVTRWGKDRFARGTYSYVGPTAHSDDYDTMAKPVGNLLFAGEATCGTHPATVHGAYISGLRAASDIIDTMLGPIEVPEPLVKIVKRSEPVPSPLKASQPTQDIALAPEETSSTRQARLEAFEMEILGAIFAKLGPRPNQPDKAGANPFLLYSKDKWGECKARCDVARQAMYGSAATKAPRNEIRTALGQMWREASDEVKRPYIERTVENRATNQENASTFQDRLAEWDAEAMDVRRQYVREHPNVLSADEERNMWQALGVYAGIDRKAKRMSGYADLALG